MFKDAQDKPLLYILVGMTLIVSVVMLFIVLGLRAEQNSMIQDCRDYVAQTLDVCQTELSTNRSLSDRQKLFLQNILERYKELRLINRKKGAAYTLDKKVIYMNPTNVMNVNQFVLLHELTHIGTDEYGDDSPIFWENNKYLLQLMTDYGAYTPIDYQRTSQLFHGMFVDSSPLYISQIQNLNNISRQAQKQYVRRDGQFVEHFQGHRRNDSGAYTNPGFQISTEPQTINLDTAYDRRGDPLFHPTVGYPGNPANEYNKN